MREEVDRLQHDQQLGTDAQLRQGLWTLAHELTLAEARERNRIARDLHDDIGQALAAARFKVQELQQGLSAPLAATCNELSELLAQASRCVRSATFDLSSPALRVGLHEALTDLAHRLSRQGGPTFRLRGHLPPLAWAEPVLAVLYRVARELMLNVVRHAHARHAWIEFAHDDHELRIAVGDDGLGIAPDWAELGVSREGGFGLVSARAQMQALGGALAVESGPGSGTLATLSLPLRRMMQP
jgi:signal transduction histidine kinase